MRRRRLLMGVGAPAAAWPLGAFAQTPRRPTIGLLFHSNPEPSVTTIRAALVRLGYRDGETVELEIRVANGSQARLAESAADLAARGVDVIFAWTTPAVIAAKAATSSIPIVMAAADPVGSGLVSSLARPGGNITGVSLAVPQVAGAILGLLREALPGARRIGALVNVSDPFHRQLLDGIETANRNVRMDVRVHGVAGQEEMETAFARMAADRIDAAIIQPTLPRAAAIDLGLRHRIPTASPTNGYAASGGFLSYAGKLTEIFAVTAAQVDQVLKGARPADIPVRQPTKFELELNLKTAQAMGLTLPPLILAQADVLIE